MEQLIAGARDALSGFLSTMLGEEAPLELTSPEETPFRELAASEQETLDVLGTTEPGFLIRLSPGWLPLLSKAMLGEEVKAGEEGFEDLVSELLGQAYGAVRTSLSSSGITLPESTFQIIPKGESIPSGKLPDTLWKVSFTMENGGNPLEGAVYLPTLPDVMQAKEEARPEQPRAAAPSESVPVKPLQFPDLGQESLGDGGHSFGLLADVELEVTVELGRRRLPLADILRLTNGSVIELEKLVGEPLEIYANGRYIAQGEAVVIDEQFGIRITALASPRRAEKAIH